MDNIRLKNTVLLILFFLDMNAWGQHELIPTGTTTSIDLKKTGNMVVISGVHNFLAKCTGNCDDLIVLNPPGLLNYFNGHLNIMDTSVFYLSSFAPSIPYHAMVFKTTDGGQNWVSVLDTISSEFFTKGLLVFDTNRLVLPVSLYQTFVTNNGGSSWELGAQHSLSTLSGSLKVNDSISVLGIGSHLMTTTDKGESWVHSSFIPADPINYFSLSLDSLYAVSSGTDGVYFSFRFGQGNTWINELIPLFAPTALHVVSKNEIYITGKGWPQEVGRIMKTTDLGNTWSYYDVPETERLLELVFLNDSIALIGGYDGVLVKWNKNSPMTEWGLGVAENNNGIVSAAAYPNPAAQEQELEISTNPGGKIEVELYDLQGRNCGMIYSGIAEKEKQTILVNVSNLDAGTYVYRLQVGDRTGQIRFVKQ